MFFVSITRIVPKLEALNLQETPLREIMDELHAKRALFDPSRTKIRPILFRLLKKWASIANLTTHHQSAYYRGQYIKPAISVFDYCLTLRLPEVCAIVTKRLLNPAKLDTEYIKNQLAPLLPDLSALLAKQQQPPSSPPFAPLFRTTMLYYTEKVLGPRPPDTLGKHLQALSKWTCSCEVCPTVRKFLTSEGIERREWQRIGAPKRRHLEQHLDLHARLLATHAMIRSTPQGLSVRDPEIAARRRRKLITWCEGDEGKGPYRSRAVGGTPEEGPRHAQEHQRGPRGGQSSARRRPRQDLGAAARASGRKCPSTSRS